MIHDDRLDQAKALEPVEGAGGGLLGQLQAEQEGPVRDRNHSILRPLRPLRPHAEREPPRGGLGRRRAQGPAGVVQTPPRVPAPRPQPESDRGRRVRFGRRDIGVGHRARRRGERRCRPFPGRLPLRERPGLPRGDPEPRERGGAGRPQDIQEVRVDLRLVPEEVQGRHRPEGRGRRGG